MEIKVIAKQKYKLTDEKILEKLTKDNYDTLLYDNQKPASPLELVNDNKTYELDIMDCVEEDFYNTLMENVQYVIVDREGFCCDLHDNKGNITRYFYKEVNG